MFALSLQGGTACAADGTIGPCTCSHLEGRTVRHILAARSPWAPVTLTVQDSAERENLSALVRREQLEHV
jgi:hypothetical protein